MTRNKREKTYYTCLFGNRAVRKLSGGWVRFLKDNALKEGDVCIFELVHGTRYQYVLKVSIFRGSQ